MMYIVQSTHIWILKNSVHGIFQQFVKMFDIEFPAQMKETVSQNNKWMK